MGKRRDVEKETAQILSVIADGYSPSCLIWEQLGGSLTRAQVTKRLLDLVKAGKVVRKHRGIYNLAPGVVAPKVEIDRPKSWTDKMSAFFSFRAA